MSGAFSQNGADRLAAAHPHHANTNGLGDGAGATLPPISSLGYPGHAPHYPSSQERHPQQQNHHPHHPPPPPPPPPQHQPVHSTHRSPWPPSTHNPSPAGPPPVVPSKRPHSPVNGPVSTPLSNASANSSAPPPTFSGPATSISTSSSNSTNLFPAHVCHICQRVYERADHLTRHLRSHENARSYACTRCPKRFNRADLLSRHEATHDREGARGRNFQRRGDRASEACQNCAASKAKCDDKKPCSRCVSKDLSCSVPPRRPDQRWDSDYPVVVSPARSASSTDGHGTERSQDEPMHSKPKPQVHIPTSAPAARDDSSRPISTTPTKTVTTPIATQIAAAWPTSEASNGDAQFEKDAEALAADDLDAELFRLHLTPQGQDDSFAWDDNLQHLYLPVDKTCRARALKNSPYTPAHMFGNESGAIVSSQSNLKGRGLHLSGESVFLPPMMRRKANRTPFMRDLTDKERDSIFAMVLNAKFKANPPCAFPSTKLMNELFQDFLAVHRCGQDNWIHWSSMTISGSSTELLAAVIASAAVETQVPAITHFGLALSEVVSTMILDKLRDANPYDIDLTTAQAAMTCIEVGIWSGSHRLMEQTSTLLSLLITKLRRGGKISIPADTPDMQLRPEDNQEVLERKWKLFVRKESYRRLALRVFFYDVRMAIASGKQPLMSFAELTFNLPAAPQLWGAESAEQWRKGSNELSRGLRGLPRVADLMEGLGLVARRGTDEHDDDLSTKAILHGFYGLTAAYRETLKSYMAGPRSVPSVYNLPPRPASLLTLHEDLYRDVCDFSRHIDGPHGGSALFVFAEFLKLLMFVSVDYLQTLSDTAGPVELGRAFRSIEQEWSVKNYSRYALWHAAQVIRHAKNLPLGGLYGTNGVAVYYAGLALWAYGLISGRVATVGTWRPPGTAATEEPGLVVMDEEETPAVRAFLDDNVGAPAVTLDKGPEEERKHVLDAARGLFLEHYAHEKEAMPPMVSKFVRSLTRVKAGKY